MDQQLDTAATGPLWLKTPEVARSVSQALDAGHAWVIMSNHVHILLSPQVPVHKAIMNVKSASARAANKILNRTGVTSGRTNRTITGCAMIGRGTRSFAISI